MNRRCSGFTLMELLLAMALLSVLMVLLLASLNISARSWDGGETKLQRITETAALARFFYRQVAQAQPLWQRNNDAANSGVQVGGVALRRDPEGFSFQGANSRLRFAGWLPESAARPGAQWFLLELIQENGVNALQVSVKPFDPPPEGRDWPWDSVILLSGVQGFQLRFFGGESNGVFGWQNAWLDKTELPQLLGVTWSTDSGDYHPELVVALRNAQDIAPEVAEDDGNDN